MAYRKSKYTDVVVPEEYARSYQAKYIAIHLDKAAFFEDASDEVAATLIRAALSYARTREVPQLSGIAKTFFSVLKSDLDEDLQRAMKMSYSSELHGGNIRGKGVNKKIEEENMKIEIVREEEKKESRKRKGVERGKTETESDALHAPAKKVPFNPPTLDEVNELWRFEKLSGNPQQFFQYYESNGWHVGKSQMKDWKAAAVSWSVREKTFSSRPQPPKSETEQRIHIEPTEIQSTIF